MKKSRKNIKRKTKGSVLYRPWITVKGRKLHARDYGRKAWRIEIPANKKNR